ncbi:MAG: alpha/beta hydrolase [Mycobacteriales bacterium]
MRRSHALLVVFALLVAGCSGPAQPSPPRPATTTTTEATPSGRGLAWVSCQGSYQCATLSVPLDYAAPAGRQISLALIRSSATDPAERIGDLVINPGGPGESTLGEFGFLVGQLSASLRAHFTIVGFDPRGVGQSTPVTCLDGPGLDRFFALDLDPQTLAQQQALVSGAQAFAAGCEARSGYLLPFVGTVNAARDIDAIRAALGDRTISYFGFSYGTYLGAEYAQEFPTHLRAAALDGALDPTLPPVVSTDDQSVGFEDELLAFIANCAGQAACSWNPPGGRLADLQSLLARLATQPLQVAGRALTESEAFYGVGAALYSPSTWSLLAQALQAADAGNGSPLLQLSDFYTERNSNGTYSNAIEAELAVDCRDAPWPTAPATYFADAAAAAHAAPVFGAPNLLSSLPCAFWPARASGPTPPLRALGAPPILVVATTGDPATPYAEGVALSRELVSGHLLTRVGEGHTGYNSSACVQADVDRYLETLALPAPGTRCP